jgi:hypothetical protein
MNPINWDSLYDEYRRYWSTARYDSRPDPHFEPGPMALARMTQPTHDDAGWLIESLRLGGEPPQGPKWFMFQLLRESQSLADIFFVPVLDAAIDEVDPSYNRHFVEPCLRSFGPRRVNEYLLSVVESGTDFRKAGAVNALYWAEALSFPDNTASFRVARATTESGALSDNLQDVWERKNRLLLETFVADSGVHLKRSIIKSLDLNPRAYPESHRPLVAQAIDLARRHDDEYIRRRVEIQLGDFSEGFAALPPRDKGRTPA